MQKSQKVLIFVAIVLSVVLCIGLIDWGYEDFQMALAGKFTSLAPNVPTRIFLGSLYLAINLIYLVWLIRWQLAGLWGQDTTTAIVRSTTASPPQFRNVLTSSLAFLAIAFLSYPLSNDIYLYLQYGLMGLNQINPYLVRAGSVTTEMSLLLRWLQTSTYGPVSQAWFMAAAILVPLSPFVAIYAFKFFCLLIHIFNGYLVWRLLKTSAIRDRLTLAFLVNPILLFEQVGSAHVDIFITTAILMMIGAFQQRQYAWGMVVAWLGLLAKTLPLIWLPLGTIWLMRHRQWRSLVLAGLVIGGSIVALQQTVLPSVFAWKSLLNPGVSGRAINSLQALFWLSIKPIPMLTKASQRVLLDWFQTWTLAIFAGYYLFALAKLALTKHRDEAQLFLEIGWVTIVLLLFATPWLMPWYVSILIPIATIYFTAQRFVWLTLILCLTNSCAYLLIGSGFVQPIVVVGIPILVLLSQFLSPAKPATSR